MESLARLVALIFFSIYGVTLVFELLVLVFAIIYFAPDFGGWWYCLWIPIIMSANWLLAMLILILLSKISSKS